MEIVPNAPKTWIPETVPEVEGVLRTLILDEVFTRSPTENLVGMEDVTILNGASLSSSIIAGRSKPELKYPPAKIL